MKELVIVQQANFAISSFEQFVKITGKKEAEIIVPHVVIMYSSLL